MSVYLQDSDFTLYVGDVRDVLATLPDESVDCCVTSPPYWGLRDYGCEAQLGLERTPDEYVAAMVDVFTQVRRMLKPEGTLWLNLGDSYAGSGKGPSNEGSKQRTNAGSLIPGVRNPQQFAGGQAPTEWLPVPKGIKAKDLIGIPWRVAFALQADGWWLRSDIVWSKPNPMPESVTDRPTKFAVYPEELPRRCILAGCPAGGTVLDPFMGSGTTAKVARDHGRKAIGVELNPEYAALCAKRLSQLSLLAP